MRLPRPGLTPQLARLIDQTHASAAPAGPRRRSRQVEFLLHAASIHEADIANFGYAIHELMVRVGVAEPSHRIGEPMTDEQLWASVEVGLIWLRRLHSLALSDEQQSEPCMRKRLQDDDLEPIMDDMRRARVRARWAGGQPLWLVAVNLAACAVVIAAAIHFLTRSAPVVDAAGAGTLGLERRIVELESQLRVMSDDATYRQKLANQSDQKLRDRIEALEKHIND